MTSWCFARKRRNSFYLYGDGDDVAIIQDIERGFAIKITDEEAEAIRNFGDLFDTVLAKIDEENRLDDIIVWQKLEDIVKRQLSGRYAEKIKVDRKTSFFLRDAVE